MHLRIPLFALGLFLTDTALGARFAWLGVNRLLRSDGAREVSTAQFARHGEVLADQAIVETVVFHDPDYDSHWVEDSAGVAKWFVRRGFDPKNVPELGVWLTDKISHDAAVGTSVVFAMGVAPTSIVYAPFEDCLLAHYVKAGGRVVWLANVPMYVAQAEIGPKIIYGATPRQNMLGLSSDPQTFYGAEGPTLTATGLAWDLESVHGLTRPVLNQGLAACFFSDPTNEHCGVGLVNARHDVPLSGFIFMPDPIDPSKEGLLRNAYRLAKWSGNPVTIPPPADLPEENAPLVASLRLGELDTRSTFLRGESVPLYLRLNSHISTPFAVWAVVTIADGRAPLRDWTVSLDVTPGDTEVFLGHVDLRRLRRDEYRVSVTFAPAMASVPEFDPHGMTVTRGIRVAPAPDHEGTHVALWVGASPSLKRTGHLLDWLDEHHIEPLFADDYAAGRDLSLWYGMSFSTRRLGNSLNAPATPGHDSWRRGANGEIMPVLAQGNQRVAMGYANPFRRQMEADDVGQQVHFDASFPAFRRRTLTSDDYSQWFGLDYNTYATEAFRDRYGIDAPRPAILGDSSDIGQVPPPPPGFVADDDPWLLLNRYWCEDVHGDTARRMSRAMHDNTEGTGKIGQISGGMQIPVMHVPSGQYPPYSMGNKGYSLLSFYYYNRLWQPPLAHIWWLEVARMGNRGREQWIMPDSGYEGDKTSALYDHFGWLMLAGGATGIQYFNDASMRPGGISAMTTLGHLSKEYGKLLAKLVPAPKKVGLLVPFEQLVYKPTSSYEMVYPFMDLLQAKVDVEPVSPDELNAANIQQYEAIIVAQTNWLKASTAVLLAQYAQGRGKLILDEPSAQALDIPGAVKVAMRIGGTSIAETSIAQQIANTKSALSTFLQTTIDCEDPNITLRRFEASGAPYLYVNHNLTNSEYLAHRQANFQIDALAERMGYGHDVISARIVRPNDRRIPFDVLAHKVLPFEIHRGRMHFDVRVPKWQGRLIAFLPEVPMRLQLVTSRKITMGATAGIKVRWVGTSGDVDALFPVHLTVTDPNGQKSREYSQRGLARKGVAMFDIEFAANDLPGHWTIDVRDAMTGLEAHAVIEVVSTHEEIQGMAERQQIVVSTPGSSLPNGVELHPFAVTIGAGSL